MDQPVRRIAWSVLTVGACLLGASGCVSISVGPRRPPSGVPATSADAVAALVAAHNAERSHRGLAPLAVNDALTSAAQGHAEEMAERRRMSHRGRDFSTPFRRMERAGYRFERAGENVAAGQPTVSSVMRAWMTSPGHRRNVLGRFSEIGAGVATDRDGAAYWCVTFGNPNSSESH
jgi:uncharacterized protein YkwD